MTTARGEAWALAALIAGAMGIAFAPIFVRIAETGPVATAFWRLLLALPVMFAWAHVEQRGKPSAGKAQRRGGAWMMIVTGLCFAGDLGVWHWSIKLTSVANSTFLVNLAPVFVTAGAALLFHERVRGLFAAALVVALIGAALLVGANFQVEGSALAGDMLALIAAVFYAGYQLSIKHCRTRFSTSQIMSWSGVTTTVVLLIVAVASGERLLPQTTQGWWVLVALAAICQIAGQSLITYAVAHLRAALSSVSLLIQPVAASLFAWLLFNETLAAGQWLGGAAVLLGIWLARRASL